MARCLIPVAALLVTAAGCSNDIGPITVASDNPEQKIPAIKRDVEDRDRRDVPLMVRDLDSDDPAVRFYSIQGLRRLTGDDLGYRYYDADDARKPAVGRWKRWLVDNGYGGGPAGVQ